MSSLTLDEYLCIDTRLCSPVPKIIHRDDFPAARLVQIRKECTDDRTPQMSNMERFRDIWR